MALFKTPKRPMSILAKRLKEARLSAGMSQEQLGIEAGLDPASASTRMNRYELDKRVPDFELVERIAQVLMLPVTYFYAADDQEADLLAKYHRLTKAGKHKVLQFLEELKK